MDLPYDIVAVKFVHWTWHDTDPNIYDRHYWVPWNSYYFHLTFGVSFNFFLSFWRRRFTGTDDQTKSSGSYVYKIHIFVLKWSRINFFIAVSKKFCAQFQPECVECLEESFSLFYYIIHCMICLKFILKIAFFSFLHFIFYWFGRVIDK